MYPNKLLGQNFLKCHWVVETMIKTASINMSDTVFEVGSGMGALTKELIKKAKRIIAVERDVELVKRYLEPLAEKYRNIEIVRGDILEVLPNIATTYDLRPTSYKLISNIPYYLTSRLLRQLLEHDPRPESITLTVQKEVAERMCAKPKKMSLLSLSVQVFCRPKTICEVPPECFWPKPKVSSAIISLTGISDDFFQKNSVDQKFFFQIARVGFAQKRKFLLNNLSAKFGDKTALKKAFDAIGLDSKTRAEELSREQWRDLVTCVYNYGGLTP